MKGDHQNKVVYKRLTVTFRTNFLLWQCLLWQWRTPCDGENISVCQPKFAQGSRGNEIGLLNFRQLLLSLGERFNGLLTSGRPAGAFEEVSVEHSHCETAWSLGCLHRWFLDQDQLPLRDGLGVCLRQTWRWRCLFTKWLIQFLFLGSVRESSSVVVGFIPPVWRMFDFGEGRASTSVAFIRWAAACFSSDSHRASPLQVRWAPKTKASIRYIRQGKITFCGDFT